MAIVSPLDDEDAPDSPKNLIASLSFAPSVQSDEKIRRLTPLVLKHPLFSRLTKDILREVILEFNLEEYKRGDVIFRKEDMNDSFYVIEKGFCCTEGTDPTESHSGAGSCFGDLSLIHPDAKKVTLVALCDVSVWSVDGAKVRFMMTSHQANQFHNLKNFVQQHVDRFGVTNHAELSFLLDGCTLVVLKRGEPVQGPDSLFIVMSGEIEVFSSAPDMLLAAKYTARRLDFLCFEGARAASMKATCISEHCELISIKIDILTSIPRLKELVLGC